MKDGPSGSRAHVDPIENILVETDILNNCNAGRSPLLRRIMRKQGRINRTIVTAAETLTREIEEVTVDKDCEALDSVRERLTHALALNSSARGNQYMRRLKRPQRELNDALNAALAILTDYVLDRKHGLCAASEGASRIEEELRWHLKEAAWRNSQPSGRYEWLRRLRRDQFLVNRCHIIAVRLLCRLLLRL